MTEGSKMGFFGRLRLSQNDEVSNVILRAPSFSCHPEDEVRRISSRTGFFGSTRRAKGILLPSVDGLKNDKTKKFHYTYLLVTNYCLQITSCQLLVFTFPIATESLRCFWSFSIFPKIPLSSLHPLKGQSSSA